MNRGISTHRPIPTFGALPMNTRIYVATVIAIGGLVLAAALSGLRLERHPLLFIALLALGVATATAKIELPLGRSASNLSFSHAINFWALFAMGPAEATCIAAVSAWAQCVLRSGQPNALHRLLFSITSLTLTIGVSGAAMSFTPGAGLADAAALARAAAVVAPLYFFLNTGLVAAAIGLSTNQNVARVWSRNFIWSAPSYLTGAGIAAVATIASARGWSGWLALLAIPAYLVFRSYHSVVSRVREEQDQTHRAMEVQLATIEALALAIEAKAGCTPEHIRSIQQYAAMLAEAAGLPDEDIQAVRTAALLHDIGNMAVPEHILAKPDALTPEEFERVKIHTRVGANILRRVPFAGPVADLVFSHHERWDGLGYPTGLRGDNIPVGARILAIADCFSTLQAHRPYRAARTESEAVGVLREFAGTAFDPALVEVFIEGLHSAPSAVESIGETDAAWSDPQPVALRDIAGAHHEEQTLYDIAQALGSRLGVSEAMMLIRDKVSRLVPFTTCALFLGDDESGFLCRWADGPGTEALLKWPPKNWSEISLRFPSCADGRGAHGEELQALLPCPLNFDGRLMGGLVIYHTVPGGFTDEHRRVLGRVSEQVAAVIYNSTRFEQSEQDSHTDPLTGMANRRSLDRQFEAGLAQVRATDRNVGVVVLDLDRLKEINDTYGHEAGDRALRAVGTVLRATVRHNDICARFAGDEFIVVMWDCTPERQAKRVEELQQAVAAHPFEPRPGVRLSLSISAGAARFPEDGRTFEELLTAGDERMYHDKAGRRSRNSVRHARALGEGA